MPLKRNYLSLIMDEAILQGENWRASDFIVLISREQEDFQNFVDDFG